MLNALVKIVVFLFYAIVVMIGVLFAISNRARIDIELFPFPYAISVPTFLFAIFIFGVGILLGWSTAGLGILQTRKKARDASRRIAALENELTALRSEQFIKPALTHEN